MIDKSGAVLLVDEVTECIQSFANEYDIKIMELVGILNLLATYPHSVSPYGLNTQSRHYLVYQLTDRLVTIANKHEIDYISVLGIVDMFKISYVIGSCMVEERLKRKEKSNE
jgi:hypothetical protein